MIQRQADYVTIRAGKNGVCDTVQLMCSMVDKYKANFQIRELAFSILRNVPQKNSLAEVEAIFNFVRDEIRYTFDIYNLETIASPLYTLKFKNGDCDDHCVVLASLLQSVGYQTMFVTAGYDLSETASHVYLICIVDSKEIVMDATEKEFDFGYEIPNATNKIYWS